LIIKLSVRNHITLSQQRWCRRSVSFFESPSDHHAFFY